MNHDELFIDMNQLPTPLSKKEVYELMDKIKQGDRDAQETLVTHNIRLVLYVVTKKFRSVPYDKRDLVAIGNIGLVKAINAFDTEKKLEFAPYAVRCINNEILGFIGKLKKEQQVESLDHIISYDHDGNELTLEDTLSDDTDLIEDYTEKETYHAIRELVKQLPDRDKQIIMLRFGFIDNQPHTQLEISEELSLSKAHVSRLVSSIVDKIAAQLKEQGLIELRKETKDSFKGSKKKKLPAQNIYQWFPNYNKEQVDMMLSTLTKEEQTLITLRYGEDLWNPIFQKLTKQQENQFYGKLLPKMRRLLDHSKQEGKVEKKIRTTQDVLSMDDNPIQVTEPPVKILEVEQELEEVTQQVVLFSREHSESLADEGESVESNMPVKKLQKQIKSGRRY